MPVFLWTQKQDIGASSRAGHAMAHDAARKQTLLFGGSRGSSLLGDTWAWADNLWTQVADTGPTARDGCAMSYDASRQRVMLFGGHSGGTQFGDTWAWDGEDWTQVADTGPEPRTGHAIAYDSVRDRIVLFGGEAGSGLKRDTWEWDGEGWTQVADTGPPARRAPGMTYDPKHGRIVLFGGAGTDGGGLGDTWQWDGQDWTQVADTGPEPRAGVAMVFGGTTVVLFGGVNSVDESIPVARHKVFGDTWQWDGSEWTQVQDMGPKGRWQHAMAFESTESRIVLFGGLTVFAPAGDPSLAEALLGDTWVHNEPGGAPPVPLPVPPPVVVESAVTIQGAQLANIGDSISVSFTLSNPDSVATVFVINKVVAVNLNGETASPEELSHLRVPLQVRVEPGLPGGTFNVVRDPGFMHPGTYGIQVAVQGTATEHDPGQVVTFTVA